MIQEYTHNIAAQMGILLTRVTVVEGRSVGCVDTHLLNMSSDGHIVSALVYQAEMDNLNSGLPCDRLELKIRSALSRLQLMMEP